MNNDKIDLMLAQNISINGTTFSTLFKCDIPFHLIRVMVILYLSIFFWKLCKKHYWLPVWYVLNEIHGLSLIAYEIIFSN